MHSVRKKAGYDDEERYFHELNRKLIEAMKEKTQVETSAQIIAFPTLPRGQAQSLKKEKKAA